MTQFREAFHWVLVQLFDYLCGGMLYATIVRFEFLEGRVALLEREEDT